MKTRQMKLTDYEGFTEKFKPKKTTDDCYTPHAVYEAVVDYVDHYVTPLAGVEIVRPFWPGGDYETHDYPPGCIVIDNPPFSIFAKITRFFNDNGIKFFLFAPGLTVLGFNDKRLAFHIINTSVRFENGAIVPVGFVTNVRRGNERLVLAGSLDEAIKKACEGPDKSRRRIVYPPEIKSAAMLKKFIVSGVNISIPDTATAPLAPKDKPFGGGFIVARSVIEALEQKLEQKQEQKQEQEYVPMSAACVEMIRRVNAANEGVGLDIYI